ncbi:hypothetical protein [Burkholderia sp. FL-7-2-10-S1-D7]|uniref:hypothetical protein n=1 Tax=Burkholderia sp. FL-7-2-10-S1-D7 TaxID=1637866 RepID=UPI000A745FE4|nr:hypothetical protein [Burkholderia sp. FL-7-2-10-S1-D7]
MRDGRPGARFTLGNIQEGTDSAAFYGLIWSLLENEAAMPLRNDSKPVDVATQRHSLWHGVNIQPTRHGANDDEGEAKVGTMIPQFRLYTARSSRIGALSCVQRSTPPLRPTF